MEPRGLPEERKGRLRPARGELEARAQTVRERLIDDVS